MRRGRAEGKQGQGKCEEREGRGETGTEEVQHN